ncbi:DNA polymerase IV [Nocardioides sp. GY 10113]|uniref:DNA polymerase IV n=1 Tax=Nocardioides sp. GY 10113 TaxID=2569761 RepID=UPI0010A93B37|nr:DNA polymerase IV [Nocardioides sp. GY 10113]TIC85900.1 DNA polymerase IV [Nocardioides sp. GY 10113]
MTPVLHVDLDQFLAAVEVLRHPELAGRPVVVGGRGDPSERGVVSTASYEARAYGVGSGTPLRIAARRCPDAVFLPVDRGHYEEVSARVFDAIRALTWAGRPLLVQVLGWDEAFLGADPGDGAAPEGAEPAEPEPAERVAAAVRAAVLAAEGLSCCVGIGDNKLQAKLATGLAKPRPGEPGEGPVAGSGVARIGDDTWFPLLGQRPTRALWGIGSRTAARLAELDIDTVEDLARADPALLAGAFGPRTGPWLRRLGRGVDPSPVDPTPWVPRGHGREETFQTDLTDWDEVAAQVRRIARLVAADIRAEGRPAVRVELKLRYVPFFTITRSHQLPAPTPDADVLAEEAAALLDRVERDRPVRLLGVRLQMAPPAEGY